MATLQPSFLRRLTFASLAIYPKKPHHTQQQKNAAAFIVSGVKRDAVTRESPSRYIIQIAIDKLVELMPRSVLNGFLVPTATLVPMPGAALSKANSVSATRSVCRGLLEAGLAARVLPCLRRKTAVRKSAYRAPHERPTALVHFESMSVHMPLHEQAPTKILLVDDVVTRGATAMGAAARLRRSFPGVSISLFAIARTDVMNEKFYDPCVGVITIQPNGSNVRRHNCEMALRPDQQTLF